MIRVVQRAADIHKDVRHFGDCVPQDSNVVKNTLEIVISNESMASAD